MKPEAELSTPQPMNVNIETVADLVRLAERTDHSELHVTGSHGRVSIKRNRTRRVVPVHSLTPAATKAGDPPAHEEPVVVTLTSPMVGFFRARANPVEVGDLLSTDEVVGFIESLTLMNEVSANARGRVTRVVVEAGAPVQFGQTLYEIEPFAGNDQ